MPERFEEYCPKLAAGQMTFEGNRLLFTSSSGAQVSFPSEAKVILEHCDGTHNVRAIATLMLRERNKLSFRLLMETLEELRAARLLSNGAEWPDSGPQEEEGASRPWWQQSWLQIPLTSSGRQERPAPALFTLLALLVVLAGVYGLQRLLPVQVPQDFLRFEESYFNGLLFLIVAISVFRICKGLCQGLLIWAMTGRRPRLALEVQTIGLAVESNAHKIWEGSLLQHLGFAVAAAMVPLAVATDVGLLFGRGHLGRDFALLALLWSFVELSPFRGSDLTWFFSRRAHGRHADHLGPFLAKKSLFALFKGKDVEGEKTLLLYATLSILWVFGFLFLALSVFNAGFAHLLADLNLGLFGSFVPAAPDTNRVQAVPLIDSASAGLLLLGMLALLVTWVRRVTLILFSNALDPLQGTLKTLARSMGTREMEAGVEVESRLAEFPIFANVPNEILRQMVQGARIKVFKKGTRILIQGEEGEEAYVILRGSADIEHHGDTGLVRKIATLGPGAVFGEMGLLEKTVRTADVVAVEDCKTMLLTSELIEAIKAHEKDGQNILDRIFISQHMASASLFRLLPPEVIHLFANNGEVEHLAPREEIIKQDEIGNDFYLLLRGSVDIFKDEQQIQTIQQGGFFGEIALLADTPRTATVRTAEATSVLRIESKSFWEVMTSNLNMARTIEDVAQSRLDGSQGQGEQSQ